MTLMTQNLKNYTKVIAVNRRQKMAGVTRVVGLNATAGTLYSVNAKAYLVTVQNASNSNIDLRAEDDAVDEAVEMIVKELNPLMYLVTNSNAGTIHVVMDERSNAADMQQRIRNLGTAVGPNDIDVTGSDVAAASAIAVS